MLFFRKRQLFIFLIGIIVLVVLIGLSLSEREELSTPEQFIRDSVGWGQTVIQTPVKFASEFFSDITNIKNTQTENKQLKEKLSKLTTLEYELQDLKEENEELRGLLDKTESLSDYTPIQATVIARSPERWVEEVTINKGKQHGVASNMAVITADGMIGKVHIASELTASVKLLTGFDQFNRISASISRKDEQDIFGLIEEFDKKTDSLLFKIIQESDKKIEKGELVISSGKGGVFPKGLLIGTVTDVIPDQYGLTRTALVKPAANMHEINHVIVVDRILEGDNENNDEQEEE